MNSIEKRREREIIGKRARGLDGPAIFRIIVGQQTGQRNCQSVCNAKTRGGDCRIFGRNDLTRADPLYIHVLEQDGDLQVPED